jgi:hypothetical protein
MDLAFAKRFNRRVVRRPFYPVVVTRVTGIAITRIFPIGLQFNFGSVCGKKGEINTFRVDSGAEWSRLTWAYLKHSSL